MRSMSFANYGPADVLQLEDRPIPAPEAGEVGRIRERLPLQPAMEAPGRMDAPLTCDMVESRANQHPLKRLPVRVDYSFRLIPLEEIICLTARDKRVFVKTSAAEFRSSYTLKELEGRLPGNQFFRVHDAHIVRLGAVEEIHSLGSHSYALSLTGGHVVPLSRAKYRELQQRLGLDWLSE